MKQKLQFAKLGLAIVLGILGLVVALPMRAQDDATEKKDEPVALEQPVDSPVPAKESDDEHKHHNWHDGKDVVMVGNDFVLKENDVSKDVVLVAGNATINGRVSGDLVVETSFSFKTKSLPTITTSLPSCQLWCL